MKELKDLKRYTKYDVVEYEFAGVDLLIALDVESLLEESMPQWISVAKLLEDVNDLLNALYDDIDLGDNADQVYSLMTEIDESLKDARNESTRNHAPSPEAE